MHQLLFGFCLAFFSARAALVIIDDTNPRITWDPPRIVPTAKCRDSADNPDCDGFWWEESNSFDHNSTIHVSWGPNTSFSFSFTGSSFMIFGDANNRGADCLLEVNGVSSNFSTKVGGEPNIRRSQLLKEVNGLIPTQRHQVRVSYGKYDSQLKHWLGIDYIMLDERGDGGSELPPDAGNAPTPSKLPVPDGSNLPIRGGIAPALLGAIIILGLLCILFISIASFLLVKLRRLEVNRDLQSNISSNASTSEAAQVEQPDHMHVEPYIYRRMPGPAVLTPGKPHLPLEVGQRWGQSSGSTASESIEPVSSPSLGGGHGTHPLTFALVPIDVAAITTSTEPPAYYRR